MSAPSSRTILVYEHVTGGGMASEPLPESWAVEGAAMRRALAVEFAAARPSLRVIVALDPRLPDEPGPWTIARMDSIERLEALSRDADYTLLIAPETDGLLESLIRRLGSGPSRLLNSSAEAVGLTADKEAFGRLFRERGLPTPKTVVLEPGEDPPLDWEYPAVVKPIDGAGAIDTHVIDRPGVVLPSLDDGRRRVLQPRIRGAAMSATFLVRDGAEPMLLAVGEQRIDRNRTRLTYRGGFLPTRLKVDAASLFAAIEAVPGLSGLVGLDFIRSEFSREPVILEINPRATTSIVGILELCRPGAIAEAWLIGDGESTTDWLARGEAIRLDVRERGPVLFDPSGRIARPDDFGGEGKGRR